MKTNKVEINKKYHIKSNNFPSTDDGYAKLEEKSFSYKRRKCVNRSNNKTSYFSFTDLKKQLYSSSTF